MLKKLSSIEIYGINLPLYLIIFAMVSLAMKFNFLPSGMIGAFLILMFFGGLFNLIGNKLPIVKSYLGGGAIACIFISACLVYFNQIPTKTIENISNFMNKTGFLNFYISALIVGSILGMNRSLLLKATIRFLPVALLSMAFAIISVGIVGSLIGHGFVESIMYIALPMMGGGMGAGVIPLSGMYASALNIDSSIIISKMVPASTLGNVLAIISGGLLAKIGTIYPKINGNGKLMKAKIEIFEEAKKSSDNIKLIGSGLIISISFFLAGTYINKAFPIFHTYAWMIILVAVVKALGIVPSKFEYAASQWSQFVMGNWTQALLVGIGMSMIDLKSVIEIFSISYLILVLVVVAAVAIGAGIGGQLVGFYPMESSVTAGLCTVNMGGTGDIAVLSSCDRMNLLPFAQISTRICGALILIVASFLVRILF